MFSYLLGHILSLTPPPLPPLPPLTPLCPSYPTTPTPSYPPFSLLPHHPYPLVPPSAKDFAALKLDEEKRLKEAALLAAQQKQKRRRNRQVGYTLTCTLLYTDY